jgi:predicted acyl esterase
LVGALVAAVVLHLPPADADPNLARPFTPTPLSQPLYDVAAPVPHVVKAGDGVDLYTETWLPKAKGANIPPAQVPVVLVITPYQLAGTLESSRTMNAVVTRGYAYTQMHVRAFGLSGGCLDLFGAKEADDGARVIEWLGRDAPFSNGKVGGYGVSYPGGTIINAAGRGDPAKTKYLKAVVVGAPEVSEYDARWMFDGVPSALLGPLHVFNYMGQTILPHLQNAPVATPQQLLEKPVCWPDHVASLLDDQTGDFTPYFDAHENRTYVPHIKAAVLMTHGHADLVPIGGVPPMVQAGLFDKIPPTTPKAGIFGVFGHENPPRLDWVDTMVAWYDKWLKGLNTGADSWPVAQVQGNDGQWRAESNWPTVGGRPGQLALGPAGTMGGPTPTGSTAYVDLGLETTLGRVPGTYAVFETAPLTERLELTGQPVLDLWLQLGLPDAHVAAKLETFDANGQAIANGWTYGLRSAQHLGPLVDNRFGQAHGVAPPTNVPVRVPVRFQPTDLVVPKGGRLKITIAGSVIVNTGLAQLGVPEPLFLGPSQPSFIPTPVTVLHDCGIGVSALRFEMPSATPDFLRVAGNPVTPSSATLVSDGGLALAPVCGQPPT